MPKISTILQRKHRKFTLSAIFEREYALLDANDGVRNEDIKVLTVEKERPYLAGCPCIKQRERCLGLEDGSKLDLDRRFIYAGKRAFIESDFPNAAPLRSPRYSALGRAAETNQDLVYSPIPRFDKLSIATPLGLAGRIESDTIQYDGLAAALFSAVARKKPCA
ncbi:hypothetical protein DKX38_030108 (mitochondrion) [Salix brachista]|uniref:Uncharacterized protein n=1 Tax=Salix brachista TaxID=2182728 RepID=A0A5N5J1R4_9ROSI|nr:hypothetical protein DKX38_030108 [Salix brachista]